MSPPPDSDDWRAWRREVNSRLETGDRTFRQLQKKIDERYQKANEQHRETLGAIEGLRALISKRPMDLQRYDDDEDEISKTTNLDELKRKARRQRQKAQVAAKWKKWGKLAAPVLLGLGAGIWEFFQRVVLK